MFVCQKTASDRGIVRCSLARANRNALTFADVIALWRNDAAFRAFWTHCLREAGFAAYCWECPPLMPRTVRRPFECVFVDSPGLIDSAADPMPFAAHFRLRKPVVVFDNPGRDAALIAPCPTAAYTDYSHLARFLATAEDAQIDALWKALGETAATYRGEHPLWISTAGLGVAWLHIRLDRRPKYYRHAAYRTA
ncbi:MAG: hypothetical protein BGP24_04685 [Lysobacterales bacterium 69-70]|nr:hypothetical protein [Xanthomonadaceae bacterium]ODU32357.1 MAG: hypothetical protein ABS97_15960 [Xanthomonadaceae bacterium SCN 69-320]ODV15824.1 MAG: hypothetical protein ABT27_21690 [Xanthomonadaceae bacterium SCN 69-25]OJY95464.1 MAG: hypothetical protein BGP24_04685 [Xanthomonadales bacterium 69-70]